MITRLKTFRTLNRLTLKFCISQATITRLHDAIDWIGFYPSSLIHILTLSDLHNNVASTQKNRDDKLYRVIVAFGPVLITLRFHLLFTRKR